MVAIAMTREMGTLGKDVAQGIADALGLKVIHSELVEHDLATRLGVEESAVHRYLEGSATLLERWKIDKRSSLDTQLKKFWSLLGMAMSSSAVGEQLPCCEECRMCCGYAYVHPCPFASGSSWSDWS